MPTYEYECASCGHRFERFQAMSAPHPKSCPECGKGVRRLLAAGAAVHVKSSGGGLPCGGEGSCCAMGRDGQVPPCKR